jgi:hypothetical protein
MRARTYTPAALRCIVSFKKGAFIPGLPVQPVALHYAPSLGGMNVANCGG